MFAEMKTIPDYPAYAVTKDGQVWSYRVNGMTRDEHNKMIHSRKETRVIYQVDLKEGITRKIRMPEPNEPIYSSLLHCLERKPQKITCHGYIYYYEDKKHRIVEELKSRIKTSTLALQCMDDYNPFRRTVKDSIIRNKKYLEILEKA